MMESQKPELLKRRRFFGAAIASAGSLLAGWTFLPALLRPARSPERVDPRVTVTPNPLAVPRHRKGPTAHG
jgi:hypothetical protein